MTTANSVEESLFPIIPAVGRGIILLLSAVLELFLVAILSETTFLFLTAVVLAVTIALAAEASVEVIVGSGCARLLPTFLFVGTDFFFAAVALVEDFLDAIFLAIEPSLEAAAPRRGQRRGGVIKTVGCGGGDDDNN